MKFDVAGFGCVLAAGSLLVGLLRIHAYDILFVVSVLSVLVQCWRVLRNANDDKVVASVTLHLALSSWGLVCWVWLHGLMRDALGLMFTALIMTVLALPAVQKAAARFRVRQAR